MAKQHNSKYPEILFRGLTDTEKDRAVQALHNSPVFDRLREIVEQFMTEISQNSRSDYDSPSWAYFQADRNGELRAYSKVLKLLTKES